MTFREFVAKYQSVPTIYYLNEKPYKVRVVDKTVGDLAPKSFMEMTDHVYLQGKSKTDAQKEVRKLARVAGVNLETGFAVEVA